MPKPSLGVPSVRGMKGAFGSWLVGAGGGLAFSLARSILGNGILGSLAAPILAGSVVKGERGTALSTVAGFLAFSGLIGAGTPAASSANGDTM